jgi:hypothetical protein
MARRYRAIALSLALGLSACGGSPTTNADNVSDTAMDTNVIMDADMNVDSGIPAENQAAAVPTCERFPASGARLEGRQFEGEGHQLRIDNGTDGDAIVKIRNAGTGRLVTSFFVRHQTLAGVSGLPDGSYIFQYAFGQALAADCKSFTEVTAAGEFPREEPLVAEPVEGGVRVQTLTYTLHAVPDGNTRPIPIDANAFNAG